MFYSMNQLNSLKHVSAYKFFWNEGVHKFIMIMWRGYTVELIIIVVLTCDQVIAVQTYSVQ